MDLRKAFEVFELNENATLTEIKVQYRDLVAVWHPDRYTHNPRIQKKALEKLKDLNNAYDLLNSHYQSYNYQESGFSNAQDTQENNNFEIVLCNICGIRNRLPKNKNKLSALCGKCGNPLFVSTQKAENEKRREQEFNRCFQRGYALKELCNFEEALAAFNKAIKIFSEHALSWYWKGYCLENLQRYNQALRAFNKSINFDPVSCNFWYQKGITLSKLERHAGAIKAFKKSLTIEPNRSDIMYYLGISQYESQWFDEALITFSKALEIEPENGRLWYLKGCCLLENEKNEKIALDAFDKATEIDPKHADSWYWKGVCLQRLKEYQNEKRVRLKDTDKWVF